MDSNPQNSSEQLDKVCIIGSGNWGSAISTLVGKNCKRLEHCHSEVPMWVFEETVELKDGSQDKLTNVINTQHENVKYLPGIQLPENVVAVADLAEACRDATLLIFVLPHQFLPKLMPIIRKAAHPSCRGVSLIKGLGKLLVCGGLFWRLVGIYSGHGRERIIINLWRLVFANGILRSPVVIGCFCAGCFRRRPIRSQNNDESPLILITKRGNTCFALLPMLSASICTF